LAGPLQLGPDGKIYVARCNNYLGVINNPNNIATSCNYVNNGLDISPAIENTSLPGFIAGYNYKNNKIPNCTVGIKEIYLSSRIIVYPNPFSSQAILQTDGIFKNATLTMYNCFGQTVNQINNISGQTVTISRDNVPNGLYFIRMTQDNKVIATEKIIITD
jgi:hypothetical protein